MKAITYGISLAFVAGFALTASCGGSSDPSAENTAGSSSGGDGAHAGSSGNAGALADAGASGSAGEGNEPSGGESGSGGAAEETGGTSGVGGTTVGGAGGTKAAGGAGGASNPASCPAAAPTDMTACSSPTNNQTQCVYAGERCTCRSQAGTGPGGPGGGNAGGGGSPAATREWNCVETLVCPAAPPTDGAACGTVNGNCEFPGLDCTCGNGREWNCRAVVVCPAAKPTVGDECTPAQGTCQYAGMGTCRCGQSSRWACTGGNPNSCPETLPTVGSACTGTTQCAYGNTDCACLNQKWGCN